MAKFKAGDIIKVKGAEFYLIVTKVEYVPKYQMDYYDVQPIYNPSGWMIKNIKGWSSQQTDENYERVA